MKEEVGTTGKNRLDLAKESILASLPFFADEASVGLWTFSRAERGADWKEVVPLGRLDRRLGGGTARDSISTAVPRIKAEGDTGLYETTVAAVAAFPLVVAARAQHGRPHQRRQERGPGQPQPGGHLARLVDDADPARPVEVLTIALGSGADARPCATSPAPRGEGLHRGQARGPPVGVPQRPHRLTPRSSHGGVTSSDSTRLLVDEVQGPGHRDGLQPAHPLAVGLSKKTRSSISA